MSDREIMDSKYPPKATELLKREYPTIYEGYKQIMEEQFELFAQKHLDYGLGNIAAGTPLANDEETKFAMTGLWYRISDKVNRWKNMIIKNRSFYNESLTDTFQDLTNYGIIAQLVSQGKWKK